jgi:hypothetical protein
MGDETKEGSSQMVIRFDEKTGAVSIHGPIDNTMFCLGLLEMAKLSVLEFRAKLAADAMRKAILTIPANGLPHPHRS